MGSANLYLAVQHTLDGSEGGGVARMPTHHLVTHGAIFGMTRSGKTGVHTVMVDEALSAGVSTLMRCKRAHGRNMLSEDLIQGRGRRSWGTKDGFRGEGAFGVYPEKA